ncbi:MAG TPA: polyketide synthase dehydratase domain-containing protein, partial [Opitutaceae bacterium]
LHPGLMDGALQAAAGLAFDAERTGQGFRFPFGAGRVELFGPLSLRLWVHVRGSIETGAAVTLADEQGRVVVRLSDYVTRAPKTAPAEAAEAAYFAPTWQERALEAGVARTPAPVTGPVWLVAREDGDFERALADRHSDVVRIRLGRTGSGGSARDWTVDLRDAEAWARLMRELPTPQAIYFSTGRIVPENFPDELACVQAAKEEGVLALFRLVKALQASGAWAPGLALKVAMQGVWTLPGEEAQPPYFAALAGLVGSLGREYPKIGAACIDLGEVTPETAGGAAAALACEPLRADSPRIAWREGRRFEAAFWRMEVHG